MNVSRRDFFVRSAGTALGAASLGALPSAEEPPPLEIEDFRPIPWSVYGRVEIVASFSVQGRAEVPRDLMYSLMGRYNDSPVLGFETGQFLVLGFEYEDSVVSPTRVYHGATSVAVAFRSSGWDKIRDPDGRLTYPACDLAGLLKRMACS